MLACLNLWFDQQIRANVMTSNMYVGIQGILTEQGVLTETGNNTIFFSICFIPAFKIDL